MIERDKEYYNQKISELYSVIENQEKIIRDLQERINTYENPEDLTLFYMWIDNKAKDKMKELQQRINKAIEEINHYDTMAKHIDDNIYLDEELVNNLLEILKGKE